MVKKKSANNLTTTQHGRFIIQIKYIITCIISEYYSLVKAKKWKFPSFHDCCPICHGKNCPVRIGFYYRIVFDKKLMIYISGVPIARYKCRRKKKQLLKDLTFSLLPDCLIPYHSPTIETFMDIISDKYLNNHSNNSILDSMYSHIYENAFNLSERSLHRYYQLFFQTVIKIKIFWKDNKYKPPPEHQYFKLRDFISYINHFNIAGSSHFGVTVLSDYYYLKYGQYFKNARFLFGTAYQFR